jgi:hypothetical protein
MSGGATKSASKMRTNSPVDLQPRVQRARLEAGAVFAMEVVDVEALAAVALHRPPAQSRGLVRRVVENLDLEERARIADGGHRLEEAIHHVQLVEYRELDGDPGQRGRQRGG